MKIAPLALVPIFVPPTACVYHLIVLPVEVAAKFELAFGQTVVGFAETADGAAGPPLTVTFTETLLTLTQPPELKASA